MKKRVPIWWIALAGVGGLLLGMGIASALNATWFWPTDAWAGVGSSLLATLASFGAAVLVFALTRRGDQQDAQDLRDQEAINEICRATLKLLDRLPGDAQRHGLGDWHGDWDDVISLRGPTVKSENAAALVQQLEQMFTAYQKRWVELSWLRKQHGDVAPEPFTPEDLQHIGAFSDAYWNGLMDVTGELAQWSPRSTEIKSYVDADIALYDAYIPSAARTSISPP